MEEQPLLITLWVNKLLGPSVARGLALLGIHHEGTSPIIPDHVVMTAVIVLLTILILAAIRRSLKMIPSGGQHLLELLYEYLKELVEDNIGHKGLKFLPLIATLAIFIFLSNMAGLVPGLKSPTSNLNVTVACALIVFLYYNYQGIREHGLLRYLKHFCGPVWWLAPLMFPVEIVSHLARPLSLSVRLFGNIFGEDMIVLVFFGLVPLLVPLPIMALQIFTAIIQTLVFVLLTIMYLAGAVASEEH
ncbi:MAG: F0F1 ATP synthase subunit A [Acidobacteriia bacterium]|nr:F0F1 ATP synthase subunit A [Terriglobia bacterium]